MKIEQTRMERFLLLREQINREIELDQAFLQEEELLQDYITRFSHIDKEYFQEFLNNINQEWELLSPQLHQDHSKDFINFEVRYEINQYLTDIRSKYDCDLNDNVNLQQILQDHNYHHKFGQHLINGTSESKHQEISLALENSVKNLQTKISSETELAQQVIKIYQEDLKKHPEALMPSKKPLGELLSNSAVITDEQFNQLVTRFKKQKFSFKWLVLLIIGSIILIIALLIVLLLLLIQ